MQERDADIEWRYDAGASLRDCAKHFALSYERVRQILKARGVALRSSPGRKLDGAIKTLRMPVSK